MDIKFKIDPDRITLGDEIAMEERENLTKKQLRDLLARHMVDDAGNFVDFKRGQALAEGLTQTQQIDAIGKFAQAVEDLRNKMLPLESKST